MRYRMIALDLDGTLLDRHSRVSSANLAAIAAAQAAGVRVVPCTGRAWNESRRVLAELPAPDLGVFVGGAVVAKIATGESVDLAVIEPHLVKELVDHLYDLPEAVLVFQDERLAGHDYLVTGRGTLSANTRWWFEYSHALPRFKREVSLEDLHHTLRVGIVSSAPRLAKVVAGMAEKFGDRILMHAFAAVEMPRASQTMHVLEVFARGVDKWRGLSWIAARIGIEPAEVAAIGDQVNDLAMLQSAGCGVAMGNAIESVKAACRHVTLDHNHSGVAHAIQQLMSGAWE